MSDTTTQRTDVQLARVASTREIRSYEQRDRKQVRALVNIADAVERTEDALEISLHAMNGILHCMDVNHDADVAYALESAREAIQELTSICDKASVIALTATEVVRQTLAIRDRERHS